MKDVGAGVKPAPILEDQFKAELNLPVFGARRCDSPSGIVIGPVLKDRLSIRLPEIRVVENVKEFRSERKSSLFSQAESLEHGEIDVHDPGSDHGVPAEVP